LTGLLEGCTCELAFIVPKFKPSRLRYVTIDGWSIEITDLDGSVLTSGEVKAEVLLVVYWRTAIGICRIFCWVSPSYTIVAWD
jgi:hypothetical protein